MATPPGQSAILSGGYSPWQAPLAALFSGISAAGQPGGWSNFGQGVTQGQQNFQQGQAQQQMMQLRQQQMVQAEEEMRRANTEREQQEAALAGIQDFLAGGGTQPVSGVRPVGNYGAATGGVQTASGTQGSPVAAMFGGDQQQAALFTQYAKAYPREAFQMLVERGFAEPEKPKTTDDLTEYESAVAQGYQGSFMDYQIDLRKAGAAGGSTVTIHNKDYGTIPPGHRLVEGPDGVRLEALPVEALPGSPAAAEAQAAADKAAAAETQKVRAGDVVLDDIGRALDISRNAPGLPSTGGGSLLQNLPGSNAHNLQQTLQSVKSNVSFDRLQQMRAASPTGGALGSVTENEGKKLESAYGALEQSVDQPTFEYNLQRLANIYMDIVHGEGNGPPRYDLKKGGDEYEWQDVPGVPGAKVQVPKGTTAPQGGQVY
jgi:hypothetical protein